MNFDFSEEQKMLSEQARRLLEEKSDYASLRKFIDEGKAYDENLWKVAAEMGWLATAIPEEYGGIGLSPFELCILAEEFGRLCVPVPFTSTVCLAAEAINLAGSKAQKEAILPGIADGSTIATFVFDQAPLEKPIAKNFSISKGKISGEISPVPDAIEARYLVLATSSSLSDGSSGLWLIDLKQDSVSQERIETFDEIRPHSQITFSQADISPMNKSDRDVVSHMFDRAATYTAFEQVGAADACLEMARSYALERYTFGRPIGAYQAIKHRLADIFVNNEVARSNAYYASWALANDTADLGIAAATARISACEALDFAAKENNHIHGGIGYTWEADCHFYYRRARLLGVSVGNMSSWCERLMSKLEQQNVA